MARTIFLIITADHHLELGLEEYGMISGEMIIGIHKKSGEGRRTTRKRLPIQRSVEQDPVLHRLV